MDWNKERHRTRDRLLKYDFNIMVPMPETAGIPMIYPWEDVAQDILFFQIFQIAQKNGFPGTEQDLRTIFGQFGEKQIIYSHYTEFPEIGDFDKFYFDLDEKILYYWDEEYLPVNTTLIPDTTLEGGNA